MDVTPGLSGASILNRRDRARALHVLRRIDLVMIVVPIMLSAIGVVMVYSASRSWLAGQGIDPEYFLKRQLVYVGLGIVVMVVVALIDYRRYQTFGYVLYGLVVLSLLAVLAPHVGKSALGSQRWIPIGPIQLQPSELGVLGLILVVATYVSRHEDLGPRRLLVLLCLAGVPVLLVWKQPDLGTAIIMAVVLGTMLVVAGVQMRYLVLLAVLAVGAVIGAVHFGLLHSYQLQRFTSFLNPSSGSLGANYNLDMSKAAVANGGFWGTGLFHGSQTNLGYVPYQWTDFIFSAIGEQLGFVGCSVVLGLFALLALRMIRAVQLTSDRFGRLLCAGALAFITFSVFQSVGMAIGLLPIAGIPLPFISEGGSAVLAFFASAGLVVNVELRRPVLR